MQYIQGLGLDQVIEELQRLRPGSKTSLGAPAATWTGAAQGDLSAAGMAHSLLAGRFNAASEVKTPTAANTATTQAMTPSGGHAFSPSDKTDGAAPPGRDGNSPPAPGSFHSEPGRVSAGSDSYGEPGRVSAGSDSHGEPGRVSAGSDSHE